MLFLGNFAYEQNLADLVIIMVGRLCDREGLGVSLVFFKIVVESL